MKLLAVSVEGCGRFGTPARVEGFGPGVNILSARNEAGKSTLFRAIRACLFERHNTNKEEVAALATEGLSLPVSIRVAFEQDGTRYEIAKSFLKSKSASLLREGVEIARGLEADEKVWDILGIAPKSTRALDEASYGLLWVQQGHSFAAPAPSEAAASQLNAVIQQEVGTLVGGERARQLLGRVKEQLGRYLTESGRPKSGGPLHAAAEEAARLAAERDEVDKRLAVLDAKLDELARLRAELRVVADPATALAMARDLAATRRLLEQAEKAGGELKRLAAEERQAHALAEAQQEKHDALVQRAATIDAQRGRLAALRAEAAPREAEMEQAGDTLSQLAAQKAAQDGELEALDAEERELSRLAELGARLAQRAELARRLTALEALRGQAAANDAALEAARVDEAALKALEALENEAARLNASLAAGAPRIAIEAAPAADVRVDGAAVSGRSAHAATQPLRITVGGDVSITVSPPQATREAAERALSEHRGKLAALLAACGAADAAELRRLRGERLGLEEQARELRAARAALALPDGVSPEIDRLQRAIAEIDAAAGAAALPAIDDIGERRQRLADQRRTLRATRAGLEAQIAALAAQLGQLRERRATLQGQGEQLQAGLDSELALLPDAARPTMLSAASAELAQRREAQRVKAAALAARQAEAPEDGEIERLAARVERLVTATASQQDKADGLRERIARLEGEVQVAGGDGLGERAASLALAQELAQAEEARIAERVEVLKLLRATVDHCYAQRREQLNAPLRRHLKPFLHDVFPKAEIELGGNFAIAGLSRSGPASELFGRLSLGTQEQVAVLVRLAMGAMICERGSDVPIILDDALVFSDDERIEQMFDAINRAGRNQQVIVLTCRARSFASLGGRQLQIS